MKRHAPATERNSAPLARVLAREFPAQGRVIEIASGTGEHAIFMARQFPDLEWQPSDLSEEALASIEAWRTESGLDNLLEPIRIDASNQDWEVDGVDAILCVNMVHISPWAASEGMFAAAGGILPSGGPLAIYGPFLEDGVTTADSNMAFDESLRARDREWGLRYVGALDALADQAGLMRSARHQMPANNITLIYRKT